MKDLGLGAPLGRFAYDYPLGSDNLNLAVIRGLTWLSSNPFVVNNVFLLLTFPAAFLASWFVFRRLGFSKSVAWVAGVVYAILPYHFWRADPHLLLSAYYVVPLGALLLYEFIGAPVEGRTQQLAELTSRVVARSRSPASSLAVALDPRDPRALVASITPPSSASWRSRRAA